MEDNDVSLQLDGEKNGMEDKAKLWSGRQLREKGSQDEDWRQKHLKSVVRQWHFSWDVTSDTEYPWLNPYLSKTFVTQVFPLRSLHARVNGSTNRVSILV